LLLDSQSVPYSFHTFAGIGVYFDPQFLLRPARIHSEGLEQGKVPINVVQSRVPIHTMMIEKPSRALAESDPARDTGKK
jgi:hypothetical protein